MDRVDGSAAAQESVGVYLARPGSRSGWFRQASRRDSLLQPCDGTLELGTGFRILLAYLAFARFRPVRFPAPLRGRSRLECWSARRAQGLYSPKVKQSAVRTRGIQQRSSQPNWRCRSFEGEQSMGHRRRRATRPKWGAFLLRQRSQARRLGAEPSGLEVRRAPRGRLRAPLLAVHAFLLRGWPPTGGRIWNRLSHRNQPRPCRLHSPLAPLYRSPASARSRAISAVAIASRPGPPEQGASTSTFISSRVPKTAVTDARSAPELYPPSRNRTSRPVRGANERTSCASCAKSPVERTSSPRGSAR